MNIFFKKVSQFLFTVVIYTSISIILLSMFFYLNLDVIPAFNISTSYSFNEKVEFLRKKKRTNLDILSCGSSMSLSNINSKEIIRTLESDSYLNVSSWGLNIKEQYLFFKAIFEFYNPKTLIIASTIMDFEAGDDKAIKYKLLPTYIESGDIKSSLIRAVMVNLRYYLNYYKHVKGFRNNKKMYAYLGFDNFGGIEYDSTGFDILPERWNGIIDRKDFHPIYYHYLDSLSNFCQLNDIKIYFFQSPFRKGIYSQLSEEVIQTIDDHTHKVSSILQSKGHQFVDATSLEWDDSLFIDALHFNSIGAKRFTVYCLEKIKR